LAVHITACPPDNRRRDLDNLLKATLDAMQHAGLYDDDSQIDSLKITRGPVEKPGCLRITLEVA
jgi:crossover junction endodeoxyribonuclease RusA